MENLLSLTKCLVCNQTYENPCYLPCNVTVCSKHISNGVFKCLICKQKHIEPKNGFLKDISTVKLIEFFDQYTGQIESETKRQVVILIEKLLGLIRCSVCNQTYEDPIHLSCHATICSRHITKTNFFECSACKQYHIEPRNGFMRDITAVQIIKIVSQLIKQVQPNKYEAKKECDLLEITVEQAESLCNNPIEIIERFFESLKIKINTEMIKCIEELLEKHTETRKDIEKKILLQTTLSDLDHRNLNAKSILNQFVENSNLIDKSMFEDIQKVIEKGQEFIDKINELEKQCKQNAKEKVMQLEKILHETKQILQELRKLLNISHFKLNVDSNNLSFFIKCEKQELEHIFEITENEIFQNKKYNLKEFIWSKSSSGRLIDEEKTLKIVNWSRSNNFALKQLTSLGSFHFCSDTPAFKPATLTHSASDANESSSFAALTNLARKQKKPVFFQKSLILLLVFLLIAFLQQPALQPLLEQQQFTKKPNLTNISSFSFGNKKVLVFMPNISLEFAVTDIKKHPTVNSSNKSEVTVICEAKQELNLAKINKSITKLHEVSVNSIPTSKKPNLGFLKNGSKCINYIFRNEVLKCVLCLYRSFLISAKRIAYA